MKNVFSTSPNLAQLLLYLNLIHCRHNTVCVIVPGNEPYVSANDALLGHHEDEADEDGRAQHADGAHERVGSFCLLATQACGESPDDHA